jgi:hypothetical protein
MSKARILADLISDSQITASEITGLELNAIQQGDTIVEVSDTGSGGKVVVRVDGADNAEFNAGGMVIPSGTTAERDPNAVVGSLRYNTTTGFFETFTGSGWGSVATPPSITGITPSNFNGEAGATFTVDGAFFDAATTALFKGADGTEYAASTVTFVNSSQITITNATNLPVANEPFKVKITNGAGLAVESVQGIDAGSVPAFTTAAGNVATTTRWDDAVSVTVQATDAENTISGYAITQGNLPAGLSLNAATGAITGTSTEQATTTYTFTIEATDSVGNTNTRQFNIQIVNAAPVWSSPAEGGTVTADKDAAFTLALSASDLEGSAVSYSSSNLPTGLSISGSSITGTPTILSNNSVSVSASDGFMSSVRNFSLNVVSPPIVINPTYFSGRTGNIQTRTLAAGTYEFEVIGAQPPAQTGASPFYDGGQAAIVTARLTFSGSTTVRLLVGQKPTASPYHGGAGGSFVAISNTPLVVAGGGGSHRCGNCAGRFGSLGGSVDQMDANILTGLGQSDGKSNNKFTGGSNGNAGQDTVNADGGAGAGFYTDAPSIGDTGALSFTNGGTGGFYSFSGQQMGGFGGGGAGGWGGSGGGGGYNGGASGQNCVVNCGGGGGSFITTSYSAVFVSSSLATSLASSSGHNGSISITTL